jgi:hypothetical protein
LAEKGSEEEAAAVKEFLNGLMWMEEELIKRGAFLFGGR